MSDTDKLRKLMNLVESFDDGMEDDEDASEEAAYFLQSLIEMLPSLFDPETAAKHRQCLEQILNELPS